MGTKISEIKTPFSSYQKSLNKGDLPVDEWVRTIDPLTFGPSRYYIDNNGEFYVLSSAIVVKGQGVKAAKSTSEVIGRAKMAMQMSLNVQYKEQGSVADDLVFDEDDSRVSTKVENQLQAKGNSMLPNDTVWEGSNLTMQLQDSADSEEIRFRIIKISAKSIHDAYHAVLLNADTAAQNKRANYRIEGSRMAARDHVKTAEAQAAASRVEGYAKTQSEIAKMTTVTPAKPVPANPTTSVTVEVTVESTKEKSAAPVKTIIKKDNTPVPDF
jgi:hypothetical protein